MTDIEMQDFLPAPRVSPHRPAPIQLPDDPRLATALVLAYVNGADSIDWAPALEALTLRAEALSDVDPPTSYRVAGRATPRAEQPVPEVRCRECQRAKA